MQRESRPSEDESRNPKRLSCWKAGQLNRAARNTCEDVMVLLGWRGSDMDAEADMGLTVHDLLANE